MFHVEHPAPSLAEALGAPARETWFHLTTRARFRLDPTFTPADNSVSIVDRSGRSGLYLCRSIEPWVNGYGYWRPFVVEIAMDPAVHQAAGVHGRWGGEIFVPAAQFSRLVVRRVIPIDAWCREWFHEPGWIEEAVGAAFDTGARLPSREQLRDYRYPGPDVRQMPMADVRRLQVMLCEGVRIRQR